jgi:DNA-directed RNA polymerase
MVIMPKDWTDSRNGGYITHELPFVKHSFKNKFDERVNLNLKEDQQCVNALQRVKFVVNSPLLDVMLEAWESELVIGDMPDRQKLPLPPSPVSKELKKADMTDVEKERFFLWKKKCPAIYQENIRRSSRILHFMRVLALAKKFIKYEQIYFPYQVDFRGRKYTVSSFLSPQGTEPAKALLTFKDKFPIENKEQADWLAIHGANCAGVDKVSFVERIKWVNDNEEHILKSAELGLDYEWWTKFDDAWLFFAFCLEWRSFKQKGFGYMSSLPIALDGTNNGLQIYSALLRCPIGGKATNLTDEEIPQDIYQDVADVVIRDVTILAEAGDPKAKKWLDSNLINRKLTKRPVMVVPYGGTRFSCMDYVADYLNDCIRKGDSFPIDETETLSEYSNWLTTHVWSAISEVVVSAKECMDWIRDIAKRLSKAGHPLQFRTPTGLLVYQHYRAFKWRQIITTIDGKLLRPVIHEEDGDRIDGRRSINASAPNFVHSLDASALTKTVNACVKEGITSFQMIHDSYGTHCHFTPKLAQILRKEFVDMFENKCLLTEFRNEALKVLPEVPEVPKRGSLDLQKIIKSKYFFC